MSRTSLELEAAPLLGEESSPEPSTRTINPPPWKQLSLVSCIECCGALPGQSIRPYINQRVSQLDVTKGDMRKVGYYVGLMGALVNVLSAISVLRWSQLSDRIGRKPVILFGLLGTTISIFWFGLARTYWGLVISQCLQKLTNGNHGVVKSVVGEITDSTNRAQAFLWVFVLSFAGATVAGSLIGGMLVMPHEHFPRVFGGKFWRDNPYFLPSLLVSVIVAVVLVLAVIFLKESAPGKPTLSHWQTSSSPDLSSSSLPEPIPLRSLLSHRPLLISSSNYALLALLGTSQDALLPLFLSMPIPLGGLGLPPHQIGYILGGYHLVTAVGIMWLSGGLLRRVGERKMYLWGVGCFLGTWVLLPLINLCARWDLKVRGEGGSANGWGVWLGIGVLVVPMFFTDMAGGCLNTFITASSPNRQSLGATNGFATTCHSISSIIAPLLADSLFSFSVQHDILGGYAVYPTLTVLTVGAIWLGRRLPDDVRPVWERDE